MTDWLNLTLVTYAALKNMKYLSCLARINDSFPRENFSGICCCHQFCRNVTWEQKPMNYRTVTEWADILG